MNQLLSQTWILQDKVNALNEEKELSDPEQRPALECPTFPVSFREFRVPKVCLAAILDSHMMHGTQWLPLETFLKVYLLKKGYFRRYPANQRKFGRSVLRRCTRNCHETWRRIETRTAEFQQYRHHDFQGILILGILCIVLKELFSELYDGSSEVCFLRNAFRNMPRPR